MALHQISRPKRRHRRPRHSKREKHQPSHGRPNLPRHLPQSRSPTPERTALYLAAASPSHLPGAEEQGHDDPDQHQQHRGGDQQREFVEKEVLHALLAHGVAQGGVAGVVGAKGVVNSGFDGVKKAIGKSGLMQGVLSPFGEVEVLDELRDMWTHESKVSRLATLLAPSPEL